MTIATIAAELAAALTAAAQALEAGAVDPATLASLREQITAYLAAQAATADQPETPAPAATLTIEIERGGYNPRRYGRPWGAVVSFAGGQPKYNFGAGAWCGTDRGGVITITARPGDVIAVGVKDNRGGNTDNDWYIVRADGTLEETDRTAALRHFNQNKGGTK